MTALRGRNDRSRRLASALLAAGLLVGGSLIGAPRSGFLRAQAGGPAGAASAARAKHFVCPPCGLPCDDTVFDQPGTCPKCGMALIEQGTAPPPAQPRKKAAILIFDGVQIIDYTGPYEVFGAAGFDVYTVAETKDPVTTAMGMKVIPKFTFADAPQPDVLVVPGGGVQGARNNASILAWVRDVSARDTHTMSVCNGAFILANAGLLDGLTATTTASLIDKLKSEYPKTNVVYDRRFVDNGKIITTAGLSSGIDGALHVISKMEGNGTAQQVALREEYEWRPRSGFARAALADRLIPDLDLDSLGRWEVVSTEGGPDRWEMQLRGHFDRGGAELMEHFRKALAKGKWAAVEASGARSSSPLSSAWKFADRNGNPWNGTLKIEAAPADAHQFAAKIGIASAALGRLSP